MRLYRAVSRGELSDIIEFQGFRAAPGTLETKLFATTAEDAASFARDLYPPDEPAAVILEVTISDSLAERLYYFQTDRQPVVAVDVDLLDGFNREAELRVLPDRTS